MSWLVSKSLETALIAMPILVLLTSSTRHTTSTRVRMGVMNVTIEVETSPMVILLLRKSMLG